MRKNKEDEFVENKFHKSEGVGFVENSIGKNRMILEFGTETEKYLYRLNKLYNS